MKNDQCMKQWSEMREKYSNRLERFINISYVLLDCKTEEHQEIAGIEISRKPNRRQW